VSYYCTSKEISWAFTSLSYLHGNQVWEQSQKCF